MQRLVHALLSCSSLHLITFPLPKAGVSLSGASGIPFAGSCGGRHGAKECRGAHPGVAPACNDLGRAGRQG